MLHKMHLRQANGMTNQTEHSLRYTKVGNSEVHCDSYITVRKDKVIVAASSSVTLSPRFNLQKLVTSSNEEFRGLFLATFSMTKKDEPRWGLHKF